MTYKEFKEFCNERTTDGCWGMEDAVLCIKTLEIMHKTPFKCKKPNVISYNWFNVNTARSTTVVTCGVCGNLYCPKVGHRCLK